MVEREDSTIRDFSQGDDRLSDESKLILPAPSQNPQSLGPDRFSDEAKPVAPHPLPQVYSMNNGFSPRDVRSEVMADDSDVRGRDPSQPLPYNECAQGDVVMQ